MVFPGVTNSTTLSFIQDSSWFNLIMITIYNIGDTTGRYIGGKPKNWLSEK